MPKNPDLVKKNLALVTLAVTRDVDQNMKRHPNCAPTSLQEMRSQFYF